MDVDFYKTTLSGLFISDYNPDNHGNLIEVNENKSNIIAWKNHLIPYATLTNVSERDMILILLIVYSVMDYKETNS